MLESRIGGRERPSVVLLSPERQRDGAARTALQAGQRGEGLPDNGLLRCRRDDRYGLEQPPVRADPDAAREHSVYESGLRSGAWMKMRVNRGQEFVIGGYTRGTKTFDAFVFGYYQDGKLVYARERAMASRP